ncbi:MAG: type II toxin-antitoxin system HicB family antitoxin [Coriobacteriia bacterium]|nr:type II toxin-antitoxin system HicB family antitoxin [Coriobacteriia bacterium]
MRYTYEAIFTIDEDGDYDVRFPDIKSIFTIGDDFADAVDMAADALELFIVSSNIDGRPLPAATFGNDADGGIIVMISVSPQSAEQVIDERVTTTEAAKRLGVNQSRVRQLIASGALDAIKSGGINLVSSSSIEAVAGSSRKAGRPRKELVAG